MRSTAPSYKPKKEKSNYDLFKDVMKLEIEKENETVVKGFEGDYDSGEEADSKIEGVQT